MQKRIAIALVVALAAGMAAAQTAKPAKSKAAAANAVQGPAVGTWKLNVEKSDFGQMPAPKSVKLVITSDTKESLKWRTTTVGPDGKTLVQSYEGTMDGTPHPVKGGPQPVTLAYTPNEHGVDIAGKSAQGEFKETAIMSEDQNTITIKGEANGPQGTATWTQVYERVGGGARKSAAKKEPAAKQSAKQ